MRNTQVHISTSYGHRGSGERSFVLRITEPGKATRLEFEIPSEAMLAFVAGSGDILASARLCPPEHLGAVKLGKTVVVKVGDLPYTTERSMENPDVAAVLLPVIAELKQHYGPKALVYPRCEDLYNHKRSVGPGKKEVFFQIILPEE